MNATEYLRTRGLVDPTTITHARPEVRSGRLWLPWFDEGGSKIYESGRSLNGSEPKYLNAKGPRPPLFASPGAWESSRVALVEGQLDALACAQAGTPAFATTTASLAASALPILTRKSEVVIVPDNDAGGARWRDDVVGKLSGKVRLLEARLPAEVKDPAELAKRTVNALDVVRASFPETEIIKGEPPDPAELAAVIDGSVVVPIQLETSTVSTIEEFLATEGEEFDWLIPGVLERGDRLELTGREGCGKSLLLAQIAVQVASGIHPFGCEEMSPVRVLLVDLENPRREVERRLRLLRHSAGERLDPLLVHILHQPAGADLPGSVEDQRWLEDALHATGAELVVAGPLYKMSLGDPNDEKDAKPLAAYLDRLRTKFSFALIVEAHLPHDSKDGRPFGWSGWRRWPEVGLELTSAGVLRPWRPARYETPCIPAALKRGGEWPFTVSERTVDTIWARVVDACGQRLTRPSVRDLAEDLEASRSQVQRAINEHRDEWEGLFDE